MNMYDITYSMGQRHDMTTPPRVTGPDLWHVHQYLHADHRYTWDISNGRVLECRYESFRIDKRRNYWRWMCDEVAVYPLPVALEAS